MAFGQAAIRLGQVKPYVYVQSLVGTTPIVDEDFDSDDYQIQVVDGEIRSTGKFTSGLMFDAPGGHDPFNGRDAYIGKVRERIYGRPQSRAYALQSEFEREAAERRIRQQEAADLEWAEQQAAIEAAALAREEAIRHCRGLFNKPISDEEADTAFRGMAQLRLGDAIYRLAYRGAVIGTAYRLFAADPEKTRTVVNVRFSDFPTEAIYNDTNRFFTDCKAKLVEELAVFGIELVAL